MTSGDKVKSWGVEWFRRRLKYREVSNRFSVFLEPSLDTRRRGHGLALRRRMIMLSLRLEEDGRCIHSGTRILNLPPEMCDRITSVTFARPQIQTTGAAFCRTRLVCGETSSRPTYITMIVTLYIKRDDLCVNSAFYPAAVGKSSSGLPGWG